MQRRAVAGYAVLFLVLAGGAYATLAAAAPPSIAFDDPAHELEQGDSLTVDGRTYTVTSVSTEESGGGGHGGGGGVTHTATFEWTNDSARYTESWSPGDEITYDGTTYVVGLENDTRPPAVALREVLPEDVETVESDGNTSVVVDRNGSRVLVPLSAYEGVNRQRFAVGETFAYDGDDVTVEAVTTESARLAWTAPRSNEVEAGHHDNVTLNGRTYLAHFPNDDTVQLVTDFGSFRQQRDTVEAFERRTSGLWGVSILGGASFALVVLLAFLPRKE
jgi:uncharacterized Zn finger protein